MTNSEPIHCDVAVIGAGISGLIAALRSAQGGRSVVVFEKTADERYICNSRLTAGIWHCGQMDILSDPKVLEERIMLVTGNAARPDLASAVAKDGIRVVRWMQSVGIRFIKGPNDYQSFMLSPPTITPQGRQWEGRGGDVMLRTFEAELNKLGGKIMRGCHASRLLKDGGRVVGFEGERAEGGTFTVKAAAVVIADGGFQANPEMTRGPVTSDPSRVLQRNAATGMGDGMRMARDVGAATSDLRGFYGHVQSRDALNNEKLWPYSWLDFVITAGMIVARDGRRFTDEGQGGVDVANTMAVRDDPLDATVIADQRIWSEQGTFNLLPPNPRLVDNGGTVYQADTLEELAAKAGLDAAGLVAQVNEYNQAVRNKTLGALSPVRTTAKFAAMPIEKGPFLAFPAVAGMTYTMGGISIDADTHVLDAQGVPIPGLYAVGCATGGLEGGEKKGYVGGLVKSSVTGLRAAEAILATVKA
ncbi:MAG: FAD-binding protein [Burkholderiaceae bacterium]|nr:FAD-binding protein [Burkholderiaceae bacterium]